MKNAHTSSHSLSLPLTLSSFLDTLQHTYFPDRDASQPDSPGESPELESTGVASDENQGENRGII